MKNITLSIPEDILSRSRDYAKSRGTTLNAMIRDLLKKMIDSPDEDFIEKIDQSLDKLGVDTRKFKFDREEIHER